MALLFCLIVTTISGEVKSVKRSEMIPPKPSHPDEPVWQYEMRVKDYAQQMKAKIWMAAIIGGFIVWLVQWN